MFVIITVLLLLLNLSFGIPVAFSLAIAGAAGLYMFGGSQLLFGILATAPASAISSYEFLTIPMFLLMAEFMIASRVSSSLFHAIARWTSWLPGGLGIATALTGAAFGAISGSSTAAAATLSSTSIPAMVDEGYERGFASGIVSIAGTLAMLIPPSIAIIFYGLLTGTSVAKLLVAGIVPGLLVTLFIIATIWLLIWRDPSLAPSRRSYSWSERFRSLSVAGPFLGLFMLVTGLIYLGIATPVEASALGALGAFVFAVITDHMNWDTFKRALLSTVLTSAMIGLIVISAQIFGFFITITQVTQNLVNFVAAHDLPPYAVMLFLVVLYIVLGCFLDQLSILILTVPVVLPVVLSLGYDPIWFGIIIILLAEVGMVTPPIGLNVYVVARNTNQPVETVFRGVWPHVAAHILLILTMLIFPQIVLWLPGSMGQ
ncbi:TRAP transporter large permease [Hoeflea alexandrii]|uniref:TRAP transporter large permease n=1 Tax=Hoeflea alexandrii TaxID=288436 RepID=UPI0022AF12F4|nr:TRAP transporter large permease [Hoeflea alexandrii]MCZ4287710.1 TRAP transporter large permease [Hoeflea alexandrii]